MYAAYLLKWNAFDGAEELEYVDPNTLKVTKACGFSAPGEKVLYEFKNGKIKSIRYTGSSLKKIWLE